MNRPWLPALMATCATAQDGSEPEMSTLSTPVGASEATPAMIPLDTSLVAGRSPWAPPVPPGLDVPPPPPPAPPPPPPPGAGAGAPAGAADGTGSWPPTGFGDT